MYVYKTTINTKYTFKPSSAGHVCVKWWSSAWKRWQAELTLSPEVPSAVPCTAVAWLSCAVLWGHLDLVVKRKFFTWLNGLWSEEGEMRKANIHCLHPHIADDHIWWTLQTKRHKHLLRHRQGITYNWSQACIKTRLQLVCLTVKPDQMSHTLVTPIRLYSWTELSIWLVVAH